MKRHDISAEELRDPHAAETRVARARLPEGVTSVIARLAAAIDEGLGALERDGAALVGAEAVGGAHRALAARLARLERRYTSAMKRRLSEIMQDIGTARGSLYPGGKRQERALNLLPLLARYGRPLLDDMLRAARAQAASLVGGPATAPSGRERSEQVTPRS
jgi:hypothetical protein